MIGRVHSHVVARPRAQVERGRARGQRIVLDLSAEAEAGRLAAGLSFEELGRVVGLSGEQVARILRGQSPNVTVMTLSKLLGAVGLDLAARAYPAGPPVRDAAHLALLARLRERVAPTLAWRAEVPVVARPFGLDESIHDRRAWDATIAGPGWQSGVEAETRVRDVQALERRLALKVRDGSVDSVILLLLESAHNRRVLALAGASLRVQFPGSARITLRRLALGQRPTDNVILLL